MEEKIAIGFIVGLLFLVGGVVFTVASQSDQFSCVSEGEYIEYEDEGVSECCRSLRPVRVYSKDDGRTVPRTACMPCGDHRCVYPENSFNCPADCLKTW